MKTLDDNKKNLDIIFKNGDLYDAISLKEGVALSQHSFLKLNILFLSRILFCGVLIWEKIKQHFAPIEKVKNAQEQIRQALGVKVDIISFKPIDETNIKETKKHKYLSLLYEEDDIEMSIYINNLEKILNFAEIYHLDRIYLSLSDIVDYFTGIDLSSYKIIDLKSILGGYLEASLNEYILCLTREELIDLIRKLKAVNSNKEYIISIGSQIEDMVIKKAITEFDYDDNLDKLKDIVTTRLNLLLNNDNSYKDRINGKVIETISLCDELVRVITTTKNGETIDNKVMTLNDYLEEKDYQSNSPNSLSEDKDLYLAASLYLYLCKNENISQVDRDETISFYDKIYKYFKLKRNKKIKKVRGIYSKIFKVVRNFLKYFYSLVTTLALVIVITFTGLSLDLINGYFFRNPDINILENIINTVILPYKYSLEFESKFIKEPVINVKNHLSSFVDFLGVSIGDSFDKEEKVIVDIKRFNNDSKMPIYYATSYAVDRTYNKGSVDYSLTTPDALIFGNVEPLFSITHLISRATLDSLKDNNKIDLFKTIYPLGDNYIITNICIRDLDSDRVLNIDYNKAAVVGNELTTHEIDIVLSMRRPQITYTYGLSADEENSFITSIQKNDFYTGGKYNIKNAIIKGLGLNSDASLEEILVAIKSKNYSKTPIKDANLTNYIKNLNENDYFETIASLDSLICNLAASLAVESADDLLYVVGYANNGDASLTNKEAHAWAMDINGGIIDATPSISIEEKDTIQIIFSWGILNNIHIYAIMALIALVIKKKYGKKILLSLNIINLNKTLENPNVYEAYAKIDEILYGGLNIARKVSKEELIDKINDDFAGFSKEELKILKEKLKQETNNRKIINSAIKVVDIIPFVKEHSKEIRRSLKKQN